ncbi:uncharacterized protein CEXT_109131 [Caerostris extrusa]|uniref:CWH43-like N-terminal domain-containing protein n=1 Tax=Caerostris extrusa TaxID=172846 RepID=A0AAV4UH40_CAEEX|nr:uncharacterized protein CEXT_109131 [Caerostris extrusa]
MWLEAQWQNESDITQSGICSVALYFIAIIGSVMISVRYVHVSSQNETKNWRLNVLNKLGLSIGYVSFSGLVVVASFPVRMDPGKQLLWDPPVLLLPLMGAFFAFFFGALYLLLQTAISLFFYEGNGRLVLLRFVFFIICSTCFTTSTLTTMFMDKKPPSDGIYLQSDVMTKFISEPNVVSSLSEWLMVLFFALYFLTFVRESESISVAITFRHLLTGRRISLASLTNMSQI